MLNGDIPDPKWAVLLMALRVALGEVKPKCVGLLYEATQNHTIKPTPPAEAVAGRYSQL